MESRLSGCCGCLLGLAVGDAMGYPVNEKSWAEIQEDYGPNGLLGYDLVNGSAAGSAYTQVAAYAANGLLIAISRAKPEHYLSYIGLSLREWARAQHFPRDPQKSHCWVAKIPQMRVRRCKDSRMLDALRMETLGSMEKPVNRASSTGSLPAAAVVGLACGQRGLHREVAAVLGAQTVALTHGNAETFLCGSVLAEIVASLLENPGQALKTVFENAINRMLSLYADRFFQAQELADMLQDITGRQGDDPRAVMELLRCETAPECVAGALYACVTAGDDFDAAMILSVNHSGKSGAVASLTGAILGTKMGAEALPEFYLESLEAAGVLNELATDLALCSPTAGLFDDDWDSKYVQGEPNRNSYTDS